MPTRKIVTMGKLQPTAGRTGGDPSRAKADEAPVGTDEAVGRSATMMSGLVIVSRITGFFRSWSQAFALGTTITASCYTIANNLPNQLYELVMGGMLATAFLPVYMSVKKRAGRAGSSAYASNLLSIVTLLMGALAVLSFIFAAQVIWTQSFSATDEFDTDLSIYFFRFFAIEIVLYALSSVISGVLNAERDYLWSTAAPILNNFVVTASFFAYGALVGANERLALLCLAIGNPLGVAIQVLAQVPSLRKHGIRLTLHIDLRDPLLRETLSIGAPTLIVTLESFITVSVMNSSALSVTANGASIIYYARLWYVLPYSVFSIPITTAMFTELSDSIAHGDMEAYRHGISSGVSKIAFMLIPFSMYLIVFAPQLVTILGSSSFSAQDTQLTIMYLRFLSLALPFYGVNTFLQKACSSIRHMGPFAAANVIAGVVQVVFCLTLTPVIGLPAVALCSGLFFLLVNIMTLASLRATLGHIGLRSIVAPILRALALGLAGALVGDLILRLLAAFIGSSSSTLMAILYCVAGGVPALIVTFGIAVALKLPEASFATSLVRRFTRR